MLKLYKKLLKIQNLIIIQLYLNKTNLVIFLYKKDIFNYFFLIYFCKQDSKISKYIIIYYSNYNKAYNKLKINK